MAKHSPERRLAMSEAAKQRWAAGVYDNQRTGKRKPKQTEEEKKAKKKQYQKTYMQKRRAQEKAATTHTVTRRNHVTNRLKAATHTPLSIDDVISTLPKTFTVTIALNTAQLVMMIGAMQPAEGQQPRTATQVVQAAVVDYLARWRDGDR